MVINIVPEFRPQAVSDDLTVTQFYFALMLGAG
jgi:hypothetical protein